MSTINVYYLNIGINCVFSPDYKTIIQYLCLIQLILFKIFEQRKKKYLYASHHFHQKLMRSFRQEICFFFYYLKQNIFTTDRLP